MAGAEEWDEFLAGLTTQLTDVPDDDPSFFNWRTAARSAIEVEVFDDAPDAKRARNDSQEMDEFAGEFVTGCGTGTGSGEERGAHAGSGDTTEESGPEGEGLTHAEVQEHVDALSSCCDGAAAFQDGYSLFCTGVAEGRRVLSASLLRSLDLSKTRVVDFANYEANADLFMQCAFELNGCRGVRFTWEEESQQTKGGFMPYKSVAQFVIGARVDWNLLAAESPRVWGTAEARRSTNVLPLARAARRHSLKSDDLRSILSYAVSPSVLPLALYWKGFRPKSRSQNKKVVASVRSYPPPWSADHVVAERVAFVMRLLGLPASTDRQVQAFFTLLICLVNNNSVLTNGRWQHNAHRVLYKGVADIDNWTKQ